MAGEADTQTHRHTDTQTHRQTDRQTGTQTHRHTDRHVHRQTGTQTGRQTDTQTGRQTDTQTDRQVDRQTDTQTHRHTDRQTGRQTHRQTDTQTGRPAPRRHASVSRAINEPLFFLFRAAALRGSAPGPPRLLRVRSHLRAPLLSTTLAVPHRKVAVFRRFRAERVRFRVWGQGCGWRGVPTAGERQTETDRDRGTEKRERPSPSAVDTCTFPAVFAILPKQTEEPLDIDPGSAPNCSSASFRPSVSQEPTANCSSVPTALPYRPISWPGSCGCATDVVVSDAAMILAIRASQAMCYRVDAKRTQYPRGRTACPTLWWFCEFDDARA